MSGAALYPLYPGQDVATGLPPIDLPSIGAPPRPRVEITRVASQPPVTPQAQWWANDPVAASQPAPQPPQGGAWWTSDPVASTAPQPPGNFEPVEHAANYSRIGREGVAPEAPSVGILSALGQGLGQGLTAGWGDEMAGVQAASGLPNILKNSPLGLAIGSGRLAYETLAGPGSATQAYETKRDEVRRDLEEAQRERPSAVVMGQIAGSLAVPVGGAAVRGASIGGRMVRGALTGGAVGAATGAGEGETLAGRASGAAVGALTGAAVGAALPPVSEAIVQAGRAVFRPIKSYVEGAFTPQRVAARKVGEAINAGIRSDPNALSRLTPQEWAQMVQSGAPAIIMDMGGEPARALARAAANLSPPARDALNQAINQRFESQGQRLIDWIGRRFGFPNAAARQEAIDAAERTVNTAAYARAMRDSARAHSAGLWDEGFEQMVQAPVMQDAIRQATVTGANRSAQQGFTPVRAPFVMDRATGRMVLRTDEAGNAARPNLEFWDQVKKNLDKIGSADARSWARVLRERLDELVPSYRDARAGAARFFGAEDALEAGQNFVMGRFANEAAARSIGAMTPVERQLFREGFASRLIEVINRTGDRRNVWNQITGNAEARQKLNIALGSQGAREVETMSRVEGIMDLARGAVQGNSTTARQLVEAGLLAGSGVNAFYQGNLLDPYSVAVAALTAGRRGVDRNVARHVAEMLTSQNPQVVQRGIALVARNDRLINALRHTDARLIAASSEQVPTRSLASGAQGMLPGRAEENRPEVPGPRRQ